MEIDRDELRRATKYLEPGREAFERLVVAERDEELIEKLSAMKAGQYARSSSSELLPSDMGLRDRPRERGGRLAAPCSTLDVGSGSPQGGSLQKHVRGAN